VPQTELSGDTGSAQAPGLTEAISAAMVELYAQFYGHDRTTISPPRVGDSPTGA
jgi:hypothetical protein